ncbi:MAG: hypothetical protein FWG43_04665, partial [Clostridiales bacterium]|nr:hypothetical protein [Clostridiales bacterium]
MEYINGEAERMNEQASSLIGYIMNSSISRSNAVVSINKSNIMQAVRACEELEGIYNKQLTKIGDAAATCSRLKFARSIYERDFDTVKTNVRNNTKKIY